MFNLSDAMNKTMPQFYKMLLSSLCSLDSARTGIIVFYTSPNIPKHATQMLRDPLPIGRYVVDDGFALALQQAIEINPSIHDGAILCGRTSCSDEYEITGWSYRLHPPHPYKGVAMPNKGSAFNSGLAMSFVKSVDRVLLWSSGTGWSFNDGFIWGPVTE